MFADTVRKKRKNLGINVTPLIDVLFLLLIFFMVSSTFIEKPGIDLTLPQAKTAELSRTENTIVSVDKDGNIFINAEKVPAEKLEKKLAAVQLKKHDDQLVLQADENVPYKIIVFIMDTARNIGFKNIVALTTVSDEN